MQALESLNLASLTVTRIKRRSVAVGDVCGPGVGGTE